MMIKAAPANRTAIDLPIFKDTLFQWDRQGHLPDDLSIIGKDVSHVTGSIETREFAIIQPKT
ncbi:hypothetical protein JET14_01725 [Martelella lutilitoris]|uniref:Uncharacterized protein n=1 Tax=Martelella lutilitoris TaxID=2583532 RepID=A0A7T7KLW3_9HYPH|nr:hypothetical protein [Martelella lutilitoris]QQM30933.1 hypothetical protein JET14_01725 [Martelella lutilitoris]